MDEPMGNPLVDAARTLSALTKGLEQVNGLSLDELIPGQPEISPIESAVEALSRDLESLRLQVENLKGRSKAALARARWRWRFSAAGLDALAQRLDATLDEDVPRAETLLWKEFVTALHEDVVEAADRLVAFAEQRGILGQDRRNGMAATLRHLRGASYAEAAEAVDGLRRLAPPELRRKRSQQLDAKLLLVHGRLLAASGRLDLAVDVIREGLQNLPPDVRLRSELSFALLRSGSVGDAIATAADAVDAAPEEGYGYLAQGAASEADGDMATAVGAYRDGLGRLDVVRIEDLERGSLLRTSGLLDREVALYLESAGLYESGLRACRSALGKGVRGAELYPEAIVFEVQARLMSHLGLDVEQVWGAEFEAAKRHLWSEDVDRALPILERVTNTQDHQAFPMAGWYFAEALRFHAWRNGIPPDAGDIDRAESVWLDWLTLAGAPDQNQPWVYWSGANIAEDSTFEAGYTLGVIPDPLWTALLRIEKTLLFDPSDGDFWATSMRLLNQVGLPAVARESVERLQSLESQGQESGFELLRARMQAGENEAALRSLDHLDETAEPMQLTARAFLRKLAGDYVGAQEDVLRALASQFQVGMNLQLSAAIRMNLGDREGARKDLDRLVREDFHFSHSPLRRAQAAAVLGMLPAAWAALDEVGGDLIPSEVLEYLSAKVVVEACSGLAGPALEHAEQLPAFAQNEADLAEVRDTWQDSMKWLEDDPARRDVLAAAISRITGVAPTGVQAPDAELTRALDGLAPDGVKAVAIRAIMARRLAGSGATDDAVAAYEALVGSALEPEASIRLAEVRRSALRLAIDNGDADKAARLHDLLAASSGSPYESRHLAIAAAHAATGHTDEAVRALRLATADASSATRALANLQLGDMYAGTDVDKALQAFADAGVAALQSHDKFLAGRSAVRAGVLVALSRGDVLEAATRFVAALGWFADDLQYASFLFTFEVRLALGTLVVSDVGPVRQAYETAFEMAGLEPLTSSAFGSDSPS